MIAALLVVSISFNVLLIALWPKKKDEVIFTEPIVLAEQKLVPRPFRARKAFREVKRQFEDEHDPRRASLARVKRFAENGE